MNIQELGAIMEHNIDVKILLLNNGYLGMVRQWQTMFYSGRFAGTPLKNPDFGATITYFLIAVWLIPFTILSQTRNRNSVKSELTCLKRRLSGLFHRG